MPPSDRTVEFKKLLEEKQARNPTSQKQTARLKPTIGDQAVLGKQYLTEAHVILNHIHTLARMLASIRKPYLNVDARSAPLGRHGSRNLDLNDSQASWTNIRHLTNEECDQIDMQARIILSRCADRVKEMETLEKRRTELIAQKANPLTRFIPTRLRQDISTAQSEFRAAHHSSVTWYLNRRLAEASQHQKELQEERVKRQLERTRTLGSKATHEANAITEAQQILPLTSSSNWLGEASTNFIAATIGAPAEKRGNLLSVPPTGLLHTQSDDEDEEIELSASQIMQFENENAILLRGVQDTLEAVQQAESRLLDISALQMELVSHLTRQTELTDQLYEDAIATTASVEKGNEQLREARRRAKDSRLFILVFLIGASMSLLFLHYY